MIFYRTLFLFAIKYTNTITNLFHLPWKKQQVNEITLPFYPSLRRIKSRSDSEYFVTWSLSLGEHESLLESVFLKAGFEQSVKDYINSDIRCKGGASTEATSFLSVVFNDISETKEAKWKAISGNGKCTGNKQACSKSLKKNRASNEELIAQLEASGELFRESLNKDDFCEEFMTKSIFDFFKEKIIAASKFNYDLDVGVLNDLKGTLTLNYDVKFKPATADGLNQIDELDLSSNEDPLEINTMCTESQCFSQRDTMRSLFEYYEIPFDENNHECLNIGINCDADGLVTYIWLANRVEIKRSPGKSIPSLIGSLPSLKGLFLGNNSLIGTIPETFGRLRSLQLLWLENNLLTGIIPSNLGNLRGLMELNLSNNTLIGGIPSQVGQMKNLKMLNIENNLLSGQIPAFNVKRSGDAPACGSSFPLFFGKFHKVFEQSGLKWFDSTTQEEDETNVEALVNLQSLSLSGNMLSGYIPTDLFLLSGLFDLNLVGNNFTGTLPTEIGLMNNLKTLDFHDNRLTGTIPTEVGKLNKLTIINFYGNKFVGTIPSEIGRLVNLNQLILDNNNLSGSIPPLIGNLIRLEHLTFGRNTMSGEIPTELGRLIKIKNLDLRDYKVPPETAKKNGGSAVPSELGNLKLWKHVVFENNNLAGTLPSELGNLKSSESLWLKNQSLTGPVLSEFGGLDSLSLFAIGDNSFEGTIPKNLGNLSALKTFDVGGNGLNGTFPVEMTNNTVLEYINFGMNKVSGNIPLEFANTVSLQYMFIGGNKINGTIPPELGSLPSLKVMSFQQNELSGGIPSEIGKIKSLIRLDINSCGLGGPIPSELGNLESLRDLDFSSNEFNSTIPEEFYGLSLEKLQLHNNILQGTISTAFGNMSSLEVLTIGNNSMSGTIPSELGLLDSLEVLFLGNNSLTGSIPPELYAYEETIIVGNDVQASQIPSQTPTISMIPSIYPSTTPSETPSQHPSVSPSIQPSGTPSQLPSTLPSTTPSESPSQFPSIFPSKTPTNTPTQIPSARPTQLCCPSGQFPFTLIVKTDDYPNETSWILFNNTGVIDVAVNGSLAQNETHVNNYCLSDGCYTFEIYDEYGDGLCCGFGIGFTAGFLNSYDLIFVASNFTDNVTETFCGVDQC